MKLNSKINRHNLERYKVGRWMYMYLGYGYIHYRMLNLRSHSKKGRKPSNIALWIITVYAGLFSISFQRYENRINRLYSSFSAYVERIGSSPDYKTLQGFIDIQSRKIPREPNFLKPTTVLSSFIAESRFQPIVKDIGDITAPLLSETLRGEQTRESIWGRKGELSLRGFEYHDELQLKALDLTHLRLEGFSIKQLTLQNFKKHLWLDYSKISYLYFNNSSSELSTISNSLRFNNLLLYKSLLVIRESSNADKVGLQSSFIYSPKPVKCRYIEAFNSIFYGSPLETDSIEGSNSLPKTCFIEVDFLKEPILFEGGYKVISPLSFSDTSKFYFYKCKLDGIEFSNVDSIQLMNFINSREENLKTIYKKIVIEDQNPWSGSFKY